MVVYGSQLTEIDIVPYQKFSTNMIQSFNNICLIINNIFYYIVHSFAKIIYNTYVKTNLQNAKERYTI